MSSVKLHVSLRKIASEIELKFLVFFTFMNYIYVNRERHLYKCLRKSTHQD